MTTKSELILEQIVSTKNFELEVENPFDISGAVDYANVLIGSSGVFYGIDPEIADAIADSDDRIGELSKILGFPVEFETSSEDFNDDYNITFPEQLISDDSKIIERKTKKVTVFRNGKKKIINKVIHRLKPKKGFKRVFVKGKEVYKKLSSKEKAAMKKRLKKLHSASSKRKRAKSARARAK